MEARGGQESTPVPITITFDSRYGDPTATATPDHTVTAPTATTIAPDTATASDAATTGLSGSVSADGSSHHPPIPTVVTGTDVTPRPPGLARTATVIDVDSHIRHVSSFDNPDPRTARSVTTLPRQPPGTRRGNAGAKILLLGSALSSHTDGTAVATPLEANRRT